MLTGRIFSVEEFSTFNGNGIRTTVFLKGCPLRCVWCHSPEGREPANTILKSPNGCTGCGRCLRFSKDGAYTEESIKNCPNSLLRWCAVDYTPEELCNLLLKNADILIASGGGVTFSGGEPLLQPVFLYECLSRLAGRIDCALQTSGYAKTEQFKKILSRTDRVLYDIKIADEGAHIRYTGRSNRLILDNFRMLVDSCIPFTVRIPLIPTVTDTEANIRGICRILREYGVAYAELLPYNRFAGSKYALSGETWAPPFDESIPPQSRREIFDSFGIKTEIL